MDPFGWCQSTKPGRSGSRIHVQVHFIDSRPNPNINRHTHPKKKTTTTTSSFPRNWASHMVSLCHTIEGADCDRTGFTCGDSSLGIEALSREPRLSRRSRCAKRCSGEPQDGSRFRSERNVSKLENYWKKNKWFEKKSSTVLSKY